MTAWGCCVHEEFQEKGAGKLGKRTETGGKIPFRGDTKYYMGSSDERRF